MLSNAFAWCTGTDCNSDWTYRQQLELNTTGILSADVTNEHAILVHIDSTNTDFWDSLHNNLDNDSSDFDNFDDGDYTNDPTWTVLSGTWDASSNYLMKSTADGAMYTTKSAVQNSDLDEDSYFWEMDFYTTVDAEGLMFLLTGDTGDNWTSNWGFGARGTSSDSCQLYKNNFATQVYQADCGILKDAWNTIRIERTKSGKWSYYANGELIFSVVDTDYATGNTHYKIRHTGSGGEARIDNIKVGTITIGNDVRFTNENDSIDLNYHFESVDTDTNDLWAWVRVPEFDADANTTINMYYGNENAIDNQNEAGIYPSAYKAVWHGNGLLDSTSNNYDLTSGGYTNTTTDCKIANCYELNGSSDYLYRTAGTLPIKDLSSDDYSMLVWLNADNTTANKVLVGEKRGSNNEEDIFDITNNGVIRWKNSIGGADSIVNNSVSINTTYSLIGTYNSSTGSESFLNNVSQGTDTYDNITRTNNVTFAIGRNPTASDSFWDGTVDEIKVINYSISDDEVSLLYNSENQSLLSFGAQEEPTPPISVTADFNWSIDQPNSRILLYDTSTDQNVTINSWQWKVNGSNLSGTTDQNRYYSTNANLDLNICLTASGLGIDLNTYIDTICQSVETWDTINPTIDVNLTNDSFGFVSDFNIGWNMACYDNFTPINYSITWNNDGTTTTLYDSDDANASIYSSFLDLNQGQSATLTFTCKDDYNDQATYTSETYYAILFRLINEANGIPLTYSDINREFTIAKVYTLDGNYSYDFNATATSTATFFSPSEDLWFEFGYTDGTKINRQINFGVVDDQNIGICAPYYQTFYQQRFVANSAKTIIVKNNVSNCYIVAGTLAYVYDTGYSITTYTIPKPYYLYTYSNGVKSYLALLDGGVPTAYNIDAIEFSRSTFNLNIGTDTVAFYPLKSTEGIYDTNTLQIYYSAYQQTNDSLKLDIYNDSTLLWTYTETVEPNELLVNFYWGGMDINVDDVLELRVTKTIDGVSSTESYYFTTMGASYQNTVSNEWAAIIAVIFFLFGITLVSVNKAFGIFGIIICVIALYFVNMASGAWWINLLAGAFIILIMYIILMTKQTGGQLT